MSRSTRLLHARVPRLLLLVGSVAALMIPVVVATAATSPYTVMVSKSPDRSSGVSLATAQVSGNVYVYMTPTSGVSKASFWLDNTSMSGTATHVEGSAPIDFVGTDTVGKAKPWNASALTTGTHTISVKVVTSSGTTSFTTTFVVGSGVAATPKPTTAATPTPKATAAPTANPTVAPTVAPTGAPTAVPTATSAPTAVPTGTATPAPTGAATPPSTVPAGFLSHSGNQFTIGGQPFTFTGFNIYQANSRSNCSYTMGTGSALDTALSGIGSGSEVFRAWFFQNLATTNGQRDWSAFDHTLAVAKAHGVKVVATLGNQWGSCEGSQYKWASWYTGGYKTQILSGTTVSYRQFVQEVVTRYKNDPTIAMWQLINEAEVKNDNTSTCSSVSALVNFASDVSGMIKSIDSNHLINLGQMGAGQCGAQGSDYKTVNAVATLDVCEYHDYGHDSTALPTNLVNDIAACNSLGKPLFVGEAGIQTSSAGSVSARATEFNAKMSAMFNAGVRGFLVWSWNNSPSSGSWEIGPGDPSLKVINSY